MTPDPGEQLVRTLKAKDASDATHFVFVYAVPKPDDGRWHINPFTGYRMVTSDGKAVTELPDGGLQVEGGPVLRREEA
jgi:hypothetical protein